MIVDCFPWFAPYGEEVLRLRVNLLKDYVDKFIIVESNKTHSGKPVERKFLEIAKRNDLPMDKIIYVEHDIPEPDEFEILDIDYQNAGLNRKRKHSVNARVRERLQKDAVMEGMKDLPDDAVFIYGDADEVINPINIPWVANITRNNPNVIIKIPLVYLQGRADLRIHHEEGKPVVWWRAMFFATKKQIMENKISNIRCGNIKLPVQWPTHNNAVIQDMGWHFAWMGNNEQRNTKATSFAHAFDKFAWQIQQGAGDYSKYDQFMKSTPPVAGEVAPDGHPDHILREYALEKLPPMVLEDSFIREFLLPETDLDKPEEFMFNRCTCSWCESIKWPLLFDLDGEKTWFEIPRSCSVTIKETYPNRKRIEKDAQLVKGKWLKYSAVKSKPIVIFTDPIDRFISCINVYLVPGQRYYNYGQNIFQALGKNLDECTKEEKIDLFFKNLQKIGSLHQVHHFHPQCMFVDTQSFDEFEVVPRKSVNKFFGISTVYNRTKKEITKNDLSPQQLNFITKIYQSDYDFFEKYG